MRQASAGIAECTTLSIELGDSNEYFDRIVAQASVFVDKYVHVHVSPGAMHEWGKGER
jgi:hypothetical protein